MNRDYIDELKAIMMDVFDIDNLHVDSSTTAQDIEEWDSLSHIRLIVAVERHFKVKFTSLEVESFKSVGDLVSEIKKKVDK